MPVNDQTLTELKTSIRDIFRLKDESYIEDYAKIAEFLQNKQQVTLTLKKLEEEMISDFAGNLQAVNLVKTASQNRIDIRTQTPVSPELTDLTHKATVGRDPNFQQKYFKCLSKALLKLEQNNKFSLGYTKSIIRITEKQKIQTDLANNLAPNSVPVLTGIVKPGHFNSILLANGTHWKDPGVSPDHGEYTHRIQWYAICSASQLKLNHQPIDLFKKLSTSQCFFYGSKEDEKADRNSRSLFFFLFDCADYASFPNLVNSEKKSPWAPTTNNFRSPENFNRWMIMDQIAKVNFPFLSQYLADRYHKRDALGMKVLGEQLKERYVDKFNTGISPKKKVIN